jgi:hypothetical protein
MLTLSDPSLNDNSLAENLREAPGNSIIMLEDVDAVFSDREAQGMTKRSGVTFSGLLNAIDGVASQEGRLFVSSSPGPGPPSRRPPPATSTLYCKPQATVHDGIFADHTPQPP